MRVSALVLLLAVACGSGPVPAPAAPAADTSVKVAAPVAGATMAVPEAELETRARAAWAGRADKVELGRAIELWGRLAESRVNDPAPLMELARAYIALADYHLRSGTDAGQRGDALERAMDAAERALLASSVGFTVAVKKGTPIEEAVKVVEADKVAPLAIYGMTLGRYAIDKGFTALVMYRGRLLAVMSRVIEVAPATLYAAADRELGSFYARVPGFAGGDLTRSRTHFDKALNLAPTALETRLRYAETYAVEANDRALFARLLDEIRAADVGEAELAPDNLLVKKRAGLLAASIDDLFAR